MSCAADGKATVGFWERSAGGGCSIGGSLMCRTILGGLRGAQPAGADRLIVGVSLMAPAPGDKSLCFINGTRYGTRAASDPEVAAQSRGVARFRSGRILSVRGGQVVVHRLNADAAGSGEAVEDEITCAPRIPVRTPWPPPRMRP